jgi:hypothetical protein
MIPGDSMMPTYDCLPEGATLLPPELTRSFESILPSPLISHGADPSR